MNAEGNNTAAFMEVSQTPLMWGKRRGDREIINLLLNHGAIQKDDPWSKRNPVPPKREIPQGLLPSKMLVNSVLNAIPLVKKSALVSYQNFKGRGFDCTTCHNQYVPLMALSAMEKKGIPRDESFVKNLNAMIDNKSDHFHDTSLFEPVDALPTAGITGYHLTSLSDNGVTAHRYIDAKVNFVAAIQMADGRWINLGSRPPHETSDVSETAWGIQALSLYPLPARKSEFDERINRAAQWLKNMEPRVNDERIFQLLGLHWVGGAPEELTPLTKILLAEQRMDGGWAQTQGLKSDAYATSTALYALHNAAGIKTSYPAYQRGLRFLLNTQLKDGTWFIRSRVFPFQPFMDSRLVSIIPQPPFYQRQR